jgi:hypothetical protein
VAPGRRKHARQGLFFGWAAVTNAALCGAAVALGIAACSSHKSSAADGGAVDGGLEAAPLACPPASLDEWVPPAYHPAQPVQQVCSVLFINDFYNSCLGPSSSSSACAENWGAGEDVPHSLCQACLVTSSSSMTWGPLVNYGEAGGTGTVSANVAGCVELLDPSKVACATSVQQADECQHQACDSVCPVTDSTSFANWQACINAAAQTSCLSYLESAACVNAEDAGPAATCVDGPDFESEFVNIATVFCGSVGD